MTGERLKHLQLIVRKGVGLVIIDAKDADDEAGGLERNADLGACGGFADDIV
jgi:hypothetical protein